MRKYPEYKDSGVNWLGKIPMNWNATLLKRSLKEIKDGTHGSFNRPSEGIPLLSAKNVLSDKIDVSESESLISESDYKSIIKNGYPKKDDLLLTIVGTIGRAFVYDLDYSLAFQRSVAFLRFKKGRIIKFYYYQVQSSLFLDQLFSLAKTSAQSGVYLSDIKGSIALIPPLPDQQSIVRFLDFKTSQIDRFIANRQKQIELLKEQKAGIINKAVTKGINPNAIMKDSGIEWIGEVPNGWIVSKIKFAGKIINGYAFDSKDFKSHGIRVIKIANIQTRSIEWKEESFVEKKLYDKLINFRLKKDDLVFALTRPIISTGIKAAIIETDEPLLINQRNAVFRPKSINRKLLYHIIFNEDFIQYFESLIDNTGQQPNISSEDIANIEIPIPPVFEQIEIVHFLDERCSELDTLISKYQKQIDLMQEYRTSLISQAVTGKIDVREWKPKREAV